MAAVFISYRREDSAAYAGRLYDHLCQRFGAAEVFMDVDDIRPGEDFVKALERHVNASRAVLVLIGRDWLAARDAMGGRRLDDPEDFLRREIVAALAGGRLVIPILVEGASMPAQSDLPAEIGALARAQAVELSDTRFAEDAVRIIERLQDSGVSRQGAWPALSRRRALPALAAALIAMLGGSYWWLGRRHDRSAAAALSGHWRAQLRYDWGAQHDERFSFEAVAGEIVGSASFLGVARGVEQARFEPPSLRFVTHSDAVSGDEHRRESHRYTGEVGENEIRFVMQTEGGFSAHPPISFVARRSR